MHALRQPRQCRSVKTGLEVTLRLSQESRWAWKPVDSKGLKWGESSANERAVALNERILSKDQLAMSSV
jgi:hypothetical protein